MRRKVSYHIVEKILLGLPNSTKRLDFSNNDYTVFKIDHVVVSVPNKGVTQTHLDDILESQLGMSWWMIDYIYGQNGITP